MKILLSVTVATLLNLSHAIRLGRPAKDEERKLDGHLNFYQIQSVRHSWCIERIESEIKFKKCGLVRSPEQGWRLSDDGRLHSEVDDMECADVDAVHIGENLKIVDCSDATTEWFYNANDLLELYAEDDDAVDFCLTNRGANKNPSDPILFKSCALEPHERLEWVFINGSPSPAWFQFENVKHEGWCIELLDLVEGSECRFRRCIDPRPATQSWAMGDDKLLRTEADPTRCLFVKSFLPGSKLFVEDCENPGLPYSGDEWEHDMSRGGQLFEEDDESLCVTNRGAEAHPGDPILLKPCQDIARFSWEQRR